METCICMGLKTIKETRRKGMVKKDQVLFVLAASIFGPLVFCTLSVLKTRKGTFLLEKTKQVFLKRDN